MRNCTFIGDSDSISACCLTSNMTKEDNHRLRLQELEALDDKRVQGQQQIELY